MSKISDNSFHRFVTGEIVDGDNSPTGADLNKVFKIFQVANNDTYDKLAGLNSANLTTLPIAGLVGSTVYQQIASLYGLLSVIPWSAISGKPTTLAGYGITDASLKTHTHVLNYNGDVLSNTVGFGEHTGGSPVSVTLTLGNAGTAGTYTKVTTDAKGRVVSGTTLGAGDIPSLTLSKISDAGTAASKTAGNAVGNVPMIEAGGTLNPSIIPAQQATNIFEVASQAAMLALSAGKGDIAIRTDLSNATFILRQTPASTLANWSQISSSSPVSSVAGKTGAVSLVAGDVGLGNVTNESKATMFTDSTFTGTTTGVNWVGKINGVLFTVSGTAPSTPSANDMWFDTSVLLWKRWNGSSWDAPSGGTGGTVDWANITNKPTTFVDGSTSVYFQKVTGGFPTAGGSAEGSVIYQNGSGVAGTTEVLTLTVTAGATTTGNLLITLDGYDYTIPVLSTNNTAASVASVIRGTTITGWTLGGSSNVVTFTYKIPATLTAPTFSGGATGVTATLVRTTTGADRTTPKVYVCRNLFDNTYDWVEIY